jgi:hypothetical protein
MGQMVRTASSVGDGRAGADRRLDGVERPLQVMNEVGTLGYNLDSF